MSKANDVKTTVQARPVGFVGGKERSLKYDMNSFALMEDMFGSVEAAMEKLSQEQKSIKLIRKLLWLGFVHEETVFDEDGEPIKYNITEHQVGSWFDIPSLSAMTEMIVEALGTAQMGPDDELEVKN